MISVPMRLLSRYKKWQQYADQREWPSSPIPQTASGAIIWVLSLYAIWTGLFNYVLAAPPPPGRARSLSFIEAGPLGPDTFGALMMAVGITSLIFSYCRRGRVDSVALPVLSAFSLAWGAVFFVAWVGYDATFADVRGILATWWGLMFGTLLVVERRMKGVHC